MLLGGRYDIGDRIGVGGSAAVHRARDDRLGRDVAVKLLSESAAGSADPAALRRFEVEARNAATFTHPHAVTVYDAGTDQGYLYIVMELVTGGSLANRLASAPMTAPEVRSLGLQLAGALEVAHSAGIIHRDVKPSNVLLDANGNAKLADFGIARRFDEIEQSMTSTGMVMGTRSYVSPEQASGQTLGPATDVFSLGVTLYEAATGDRPPASIDRAPDHLLDPSAVVPGFDAGLGSVIATASAMLVERRFASAAALTAALTAAPPGPTGATATMPIHLRPNQPTDELQVNPSPALPDANATTPAGSALSRELADERRRRTIVGAVIAVLIVIGGAGIGLAIARSDLGSTETLSTSPTDGSGVETASTTVPAVGTDAAVPTATADSVAPTDAPTTAAPTTAATPEQTTATVPPTEELIPGFPIPADAGEFLVNLQADPDLVGRRGSDLAKEFEKVLDDDDDDRGKRADKLREKIAEWVLDDEIDPRIAATAIDFLDGVAPQSDDSDDD